MVESPPCPLLTWFLAVACAAAVVGVHGSGWDVAAVASAAAVDTVAVEVVCGGGFAGLRAPAAASSDCSTALLVAKQEALLPVDTSKGSASVGLGTYVNISLVPIGFVDPGTGVPYCQDGRLECALYSLALCAQQQGMCFVSRQGGSRSVGESAVSAIVRAHAMHMSLASPHTQASFGLPLASSHGCDDRHVAAVWGHSAVAGGCANLA